MTTEAPIADPGTHSREFRLDVMNQCLLRDSEEISLRPKAFAVLQHLADRAGRLVTKEDLLADVWADAFVGEEVLKGCIRELRQALGDEAKNPRFIQTLPRRGYRFIGSLPALAELPSTPSCHPFRRSRSCSRRTRPAVFGREAETARSLETCLEKALHGERQIVFVSGDNGIGKTALVDSFLARAARGFRDRHRLRPVPGALRQGRGLHAGARGAGARRPRGGHRPPGAAAQPPRADLAGADAVAGRRSRAGGAAAPGRERDARADAARDRPGARGPDRGDPPGAGARGPPLERLLDDRPHLVAGQASGAGPPAADRHLSADAREHRQAIR